MGNGTSLSKVQTKKDYVDEASIDPKAESPKATKNCIKAIKFPNYHVFNFFHLFCSLVYALAEFIMLISKMWTHLGMVMKSFWHKAITWTYIVILPIKFQQKHLKHLKMVPVTFLLQYQKLGQFAMPTTRKNRLRLVNSSVYYAHWTHEIYQVHVLPYSLDLKAPSLWSSEIHWVRQYFVNVVLFGIKDL